MPKLIQISETTWVNLDLVTSVQFLPNYNYPRYDVAEKRMIDEYKDKLVFYFSCVEPSQENGSYVEAVDHWARGLRDSLKFGSLGAACVISRGVQ